jgi:NAD(P)-dependent dehydrogenase (short-subunit alcohol dehydrogenase family)
MKNFKGAVAVITGGASGLGLAMAREAQARGCHLVIADIRQDALDSAVAELSAKGEVIGVRTDVSKAAEIEALQRPLSRGSARSICSSTMRVFASSLAWETSAEEYDWVIGVNQRSVVNGIRTFVPRMIAQGDECHVLTISSGAGITVNPGFCSATR